MFNCSHCWCVPHLSSGGGGAGGIGLFILFILKSPFSLCLHLLSTLHSNVCLHFSLSLSSHCLAFCRQFRDTTAQVCSAASAAATCRSIFSPFPYASKAKLSVEPFSGAWSASLYVSMFALSIRIRKAEQHSLAAALLCLPFVLRRAEKTEARPFSGSFRGIQMWIQLNSTADCRLQVLASFLLLLLLPLCLSVLFPFFSVWRWNGSLSCSPSLFLAFFLLFFYLKSTHTQTNRLIY